MIPIDIKTTSTKVVHSQTKSAWNVIGTTPGLKYKIARIPYVCTDSETSTERERVEARKHAEFISYCFNHAQMITNLSKECNSNKLP